MTSTMSARLRRPLRARASRRSVCAGLITLPPPARVRRAPRPAPRGLVGSGSCAACAGGLSGGRRFGRGDLSIDKRAARVQLHNRPDSCIPASSAMKTTFTVHCLHDHFVFRYGRPINQSMRQLRGHKIRNMNDSTSKLSLVSIQMKFANAHNTHTEWDLRDTGNSEFETLFALGLLWVQCLMSLKPQMARK